MLIEASNLRDVHILTTTKQPWVNIPEGVPSCARDGEPELLWPAETKERFAALTAKRD